MTPTGIERVAHLIAPAPAGGAESVVAALAAAAPDTTRVFVLNQIADAPSSPSLPFTEQVRSRGADADEIRCGRRRYFAESRAVADLIANHGIQLLHTHGYHATVVGRLAARRAGVPVVATVHGYLSRNARERFYNAVDRFLLRGFDGVIAVSQGIMNQLVASGIDARRVSLVQNGLTAPAQKLERDEARARLGLGADERLVGWIGRLSIEKGADLFVRSLAGGNVPARGVIIGEGAELLRLEALVRELRAGPRITFAGFRSDAAQLLPAFDVLALTSRLEGTPMVILEAVAAGVPIVSFCVGGIPDLLDDSTAWLAPPEDIPAMGRILSEALAHPAEARRRAETAREKLADRLSLERWLKRTWGVYQVAAGCAQSP